MQRIEKTGSDLLKRKSKNELTYDTRVLTEASLRRHTDYWKTREPLSLYERVIEWVRCIPLFLDDPNSDPVSEKLANRPQTTLPRYLLFFYSKRIFIDV